MSKHLKQIFNLILHGKVHTREMPYEGSDCGKCIEGK